MIEAEQKNNQKLQEGTIEIQRDRWQMAEYRRVYNCSRAYSHFSFKLSRIIMVNSPESCLDDERKKGGVILYILVGHIAYVGGHT